MELFYRPKISGLRLRESRRRARGKILRAADPEMPIKLSAEAGNIRAQKLYRSLGFTESDELDGDDLVFILR